MTGRIAGIILAGGRSTRMGGGDKCLLPLAGRPVLAHVIDRLAPQVDKLVLNANGDPARFATFGLGVIADTIPDHAGPLAGILAGLKWAAAGSSSTHIVTAASDTPFFPQGLVQGFLAAAGKGGSSSRIVLARSEGRSHPVFGLWPIALASDLEAYLDEGGSLKVRAYAGERHEVAFADFPATDGRDPFFNINTSDDLATAETFLQEKP